MTDNLKHIVKTVRNYPGVLRKQPVKEVFEKLRLTHQYGTQLPNYGDDAAVIPWNDGFLLLAADGMMTGLLINEPYAAGKAAVMVTVNDIYSMGGRPIGMVNVMASGDPEQRAMIADGIEKGCQKLRVPMIGGHLHPDAPADNPSLGVAILGWARKPLHSYLAEIGDDIILAADLRGQAGCRSVVSWDANSGKSPDELLHRLDTLPMIAERELAHAAKDVSNAGLLGTVSIMMENSGKGAVIDLSAIPKPDTLSMTDWVLCFMSFGFVLSAAPGKTGEVLSIFSERGITANIIGRVHKEPVVTLTQEKGSEILFDFEKDEITGIRYQVSA